MLFDTFGPYEVKRTDGEVRRSQPDLWAQVARDSKAFNHPERGLEQAIGCYAFVIYDRIYRPWYVGKTRAIAGFRGEIFERHKLTIYTEYVSARRGIPYIFLFPMVREDRSFSKARTTGDGAIDWLEKTLIGMAFAKNPALRNVASTKHMRTVWVHGLIGPKPPGRPDSYAVEARKAFLATPRPPRLRPD